MMETPGIKYYAFSAEEASRLYKMSKITELNDQSLPDDYTLELTTNTKHKELLQRLKSQRNVDNATR